MFVTCYVHLHINLIITSLCVDVYSLLLIAIKKLNTYTVAKTCCVCLGGKSSLMPFYGLITPKQYSNNLQLMKWSPAIQVPIYIHSWLPMFFPLFKLPSQNNCYIGYPRQTESLYTYQPHHNQLIVVDNKSREEIGGPPQS